MGGRNHRRGSGDNRRKRSSRLDSGPLARVAPSDGVSHPLVGVADHGGKEPEHASGHLRVLIQYREQDVPPKQITLRGLHGGDAGGCGQPIDYPYLPKAIPFAEDGQYSLRPASLSRLGDLDRP